MMGNDGDTNDGLEIIFLSVADVTSLHERGIREHSLGESLRVRDYALLESAVLSPSQTFDGLYLYTSVAEMAAAYLIGLVLNHPFENGNKRVAFSSCLVFLAINGYDLDLDQRQAVDLTLGIVDNRYNRDTVVQIIRDSMIRR